MTQIFVFTAGNPEAQQHLVDSIENSIDEETVFDSFAATYRGKLAKIREEGNGFYAWGAVPGEMNFRAWDAMERGDYVLCVFGNAYHYIARVLAKVENRRFAEAVWGTNDQGKTWEYTYFLTKPVEVDTRLSEVEDYLPVRYMGFSRISDSRLGTILDDYGSVEDFVYRMLDRREGYADGKMSPSDADAVKPRVPPVAQWNEFPARGVEEPDLISIDEPLRRVVPGPLEEISLPENYPLPLVHAYRIVEAEIDTFVILKQLYRNAEGLTAFLASLAAALAPAPQGKAKDALRSAWSGKGATFGKWYSILDKTIPRIDEQKGPLYHSMKRLLGTKDAPSSFAENVRWLIDRRDELHHEDLPIDTNAERLVREASKRFERCVFECAVVWQHPLRLVLDYDVARYGDHVVVICHDFSTEHFVGPKVQERVRGIPKKRDLYILQGAKQWISLYPFITAHYCPSCNARETYFVDAWQRSGGEASLRSFQRAHGRVSQEIGRELALRLA